jgi:hypothetical protein
MLYRRCREGIPCSPHVEIRIDLLNVAAWIYRRIQHLVFRYVLDSIYHAKHHNPFF